MTEKKTKSRLRILYLSQYFFPESFLGNDVARALVSRGHDVTAISSVPNYPAGRFFPGYSNRLLRKEGWFGVKIVRAWTLARGNSRLRLILNYLIFPITAFSEVICQNPRSYNVTFVFMPSPIFQGLVGLLTKYFFKIPTVFWVQDIWPDSVIVTLNINNKFINNTLSRICSFIYKNADLLMVQSNSFVNRLEQLGVDNSKIVVVPNMAPIGFERVERQDVDPIVQAMIPTDRFVVMFAGNIGVSQDFDTIVEAASLLKGNKDIVWLIVGSGRDEPRVRRLVFDRGLDEYIIFLGRHPTELMPSFFACADALLISLKANDLFDMTVPSKLQSYLTCGRPLVASLGGEGARIIEESGAGIAVTPSDPIGLASAVYSLYRSSEEELVNMGNRGYNYAKMHYDREIIFDKIEELLEVIADSNSPALDS